MNRNKNSKTQTEDQKRIRNEPISELNAAREVALSIDDIQWYDDLTAAVQHRRMKRIKIAQRDGPATVHLHCDQCSYDHVVGACEPGPRHTDCTGYVHILYPNTGDQDE